MSYYNEFKRCEQQWMVLKDQYEEIARELGFEGKGFWGDTHVPHSEIIKRVRELRNKVE